MFRGRESKVFRQEILWWKEKMAARTATTVTVMMAAKEGQRSRNPAPSRKMRWMSSRPYLMGLSRVRSWKISGMLEMGVAKPESMTMGTSSRKVPTNGLLEGLGKGGDAQPDGRRRDDEEQEGGGEQPDGSLEGDAEPEHGYQHHEDGLHDSGDDGGNPLAEQDFSGGVRGDQELVEGAFLPFAGDGERAGEDGVDQHEHGNQAGDDEPAGDEVGVEPGAGFYFHRGGAAAFGKQVRPVGGGDLLAVAEGDGRRVRVAAVRNELEGGGAPGLEVAGEVRGDGEPHDDFPVVDHAVDVFFRGRRGLPPEDARAFQVRDVLGGRFSPVLVQHGVWHAVTFMWAA